jgi:hypothetical protein
VECLKQPDVSFKCSMLDGLDALGIGVITSADLLQLPVEVKAVLDRMHAAETTAQQ